MRQEDEGWDQLLTIEQVQERLNIGRTKAYSLVTSKSIPAHKIGRLVRVKESDLNSYLKEVRY